MIKKIDRQELQLRFLEAINGTNYRFIEGLNPFHILLDGKEYWIYIKNLTSAHFTNPDVWRAQLPLREDFITIKDSSIDFIMLGYDGDNDIYATWNPIWVKQRLNSTDNVSLYSRHTLHVEARKTMQLKRMDLGNDGEVVVFPREMTRLFFTNVGSFFLSTGDYVAIGSKRRPEANESFKVFNNAANISNFAKYMTDKGLSSITIGGYCRVIRSLITDGFFSRNRKIFLQYDSISEYSKSVQQFLEIPEVSEKNAKWHHLISAALNTYIVFLSSETQSVQPVVKGTDEELLLEFDDNNSTASNNLYDYFVNLETVAQFEMSLSHLDYLPSTVKRYARAIRYLITEGYIDRHKEVFQECTSYKQYTAAADAFFKIPEVHTINEERHHDYSSAMKQYVLFLIQEEVKLQDGTSIIRETEEQTADDNEIDTHDWETPYTDGNGKLTRIANPVLLAKLRPVLDREYPNTASACNIIEDFYGSRFKDMEFFEWGKLFKQIDWSAAESDKKRIEGTLFTTKKSKSAILRVEFSDGRIIEHRNVSATYCDVIKEIGAEEVNILDIYHSGVNIVSRTLDSKYGDYQRDIGDGWYVLTNTSTNTKYQDLQRIIDEYCVDIKVSIVPLDQSGSQVIVPKEPKSGVREKIRVTFPNGRIIQPSKVLEALIEVVKYAGANRVNALNITCCSDNLILKHPTERYEKACKPVGQGWLCNTCSDTRTKYEQISYISKQLNLGLVVELV